MRIAILGSLLFAFGCPPPPVAPTSTKAPLTEGDFAMTVDGAPIAYHVHGRGPVCLVYPGGPGMEWSYLRMPEAERSLTLVYLEPSGTGSSPPLSPPSQYTLARYARLLDAAIVELGLTRACVLGHSYGGYVAVHWATSYPDHVAGLILYATAARSDDETRKAQEAGAAAFAKEPWFAAAAAGLELEKQAKNDADAEAALRAQAPMMFADWTRRSAEFAPWVATLRASLGPSRAAVANHVAWDLRPKLAALRVPALVLVGAKDWITPKERADELVAAIAGAQLVVLPSSSHLGHVEEPAAFAAAIAEFAHKLPATASAPSGAPPAP